MKKILIMEDEPDVAESVKAYLEEAGYEADVSFSPSKGLEKVKHCDLLILDLIMPKMSGHSFLKEMKKRGIDKPVIILSAVGLPKVMAEETSREFPGVLFVPKTEMYDKLLPMVEKLTGSS